MPVFICTAGETATCSHIYLLDKHTTLKSHLHTVITIKTFSIFHLQRWFCTEMELMQNKAIVIQNLPLTISPNLSCSNYLSVTDFFFPIG